MTIPSITLGDFVRALPGVKPRLALRAAEEALRAAGMLDPHSNVAYPPAVEKHGYYGPYILVQPGGARFLLERYLYGKLPMQPATAPGDPPEWMTRIAGMSDEEIAVHEAAQPLTFEHLEDAYWRWVNRACPHPPHLAEARRWRDETAFEYRGVRYTRHRHVMRSNSGKSIVGGSTVFHGSDDSVYRNEPPAPNRRNDPKRNWGLGPE